MSIAEPNVESMDTIEERGARIGRAVADSLQYSIASILRHELMCDELQSRRKGQKTIQDLAIGLESLGEVFKAFRTSFLDQIAIDFIDFELADVDADLIDCFTIVEQGNDRFIEDALDDDIVEGDDIPNEWSPTFSRMAKELNRRKTKN